MQHLRKRLQLEEFRQVASLKILSGQCRLAVNTWGHHSQDHCHFNTIDFRPTKRCQRRRGQATQPSPRGSLTTTTVFISWRSSPTARCPSSGGWDYTPRRFLRISRIRLIKRSRLWNMPVPRPMFKCIRWGRKRK